MKIIRNLLLSFRVLSAALAMVAVSCTASVAMAQSVAGGAPPQPSFGEVLMKMLPMFVVVFVVFHFFIIRPQRKKEMQHAALLKGLKNGDPVVTSSGILGKVAGVQPEFVTVEIANGVKVKVQPHHILGLEAEKKAASK